MVNAVALLRRAHRRLGLGLGVALRARARARLRARLAARLGPRRHHRGVRLGARRVGWVRRGLRRRVGRIRRRLARRCLRWMSRRLRRQLRRLGRRLRVGEGGGQRGRDVGCHLRQAEGRRGGRGENRLGHPGQLHHRLRLRRLRRKGGLEVGPEQRARVHQHRGRAGQRHLLGADHRRLGGERVGRGDRPRVERLGRPLRGARGVPVHQVFAGWPLDPVGLEHLVGLGHGGLRRLGLVALLGYVLIDDRLIVRVVRFAHGGPWECTPIERPD